MPNHAPNGGVAETAVSLSAGAVVVSPASVSDSEESRNQEAKEAARKAEKQARKAAREQEKVARAEAKVAEKKRKKANAKTEAAVAEKAAKARSEASETDSTGSKPKSRKLRFENELDRKEVASYLEAITKGLRKGSIHFRQGEDTVELSPDDRVTLSVKVSSKGDAQRLSFEVEWDGTTSPELAIVVG